MKDCSFKIVYPISRYSYQTCLMESSGLVQNLQQFNLLVLLGSIVIIWEAVMGSNEKLDSAVLYVISFCLLGIDLRGFCREVFAFMIVVVEDCL